MKKNTILGLLGALLIAVAVVMTVNLFTEQERLEEISIQEEERTVLIQELTSEREILEEELDNSEQEHKKLQEEAYAVESIEKVK